MSCTSPDYLGMGLLLVAFVAVVRFVWRLAHTQHSKREDEP